MNEMVKVWEKDLLMVAILHYFSFLLIFVASEITVKLGEF